MQFMKNSWKYQSTRKYDTFMKVSKYKEVWKSMKNNGKLWEIIKFYNEVQRNIKSIRK